MGSGHRLAESIFWNGFLGSIKVVKIPPLFVYLDSVRFFRFDLAYFWKKPSSLRFDLSNLWNKQSSLRFNLSNLWNKQISLRFDLSKM